MISCQSLTMRYGDQVAVHDLNLNVDRGEICVLLGPNGAGKSTTLKMLTGLLTPTSGVAAVCGLPPKEAKARVGVLPEDLGLFDDLTVHEHLSLTADVYGLKASIAQERIDQLLRVLSLEHGRDTFARECSHGMKKKTAFAMAVLHNPEVLFLDEPFEAIDPVSAKLMSSILAGAAKNGVAVFLTSHILSIVEQLGDRFLLMREGRLALNCRRSELPRPLAELYFEFAEALSTERLEWLGSGRS